MKPKKSNYYAESSDFDSPTIPGEVKNERESTYGYSLIIALMLLLAGLAILAYSLGTYQDKINIYESMNGIYINGEDAYIRFNMSDQNQLAMLNQIQAYCQFKGIGRCGRLER